MLGVPDDENCSPSIIVLAAPKWAASAASIRSQRCGTRLDAAREPSLYVFLERIVDLVRKRNEARVARMEFVRPILALERP